MSDNEEPITVEFKRGDAVLLKNVLSAVPMLVVEISGCDDNGFQRPSLHVGWFDANTHWQTMTVASDLFEIVDIVALRQEIDAHVEELAFSGRSYSS